MSDTECARQQAVERLRREKRALEAAAEAAGIPRREALAEAWQAGGARGECDALALPYTTLERIGRWWETQQDGGAHMVTRLEPPQVPREVGRAAIAYQQAHQVRVRDGAPKDGSGALAFEGGWREAVGAFWIDVKDELSDTGLEADRRSRLAEAWSFILKQRSGTV